VPGASGGRPRPADSDTGSPRCCCGEAQKPLDLASWLVIRKLGFESLPRSLRKALFPSFLRMSDIRYRGGAQADTPPGGRVGAPSRLLRPGDRNRPVPSAERRVLLDGRLKARTARGQNERVQERGRPAGRPLSSARERGLARQRGLPRHSAKADGARPAPTPEARDRARVPLGASSPITHR
jgi:hypothetical protein